MILSFKQGVNEILKLHLTFNPAPLKKFTVDVFQHGRRVLQKTEADCIVDRNKVTIPFTQEDTLLLSPQRVAVSFRGLYDDGSTVITEDLTGTIDRSHYQEAIE